MWLNGLNITSKLRNKIHHLHTLQRINKCTRKQRVIDVYIHKCIYNAYMYTYVYTCIYCILYIYILQLDHKHGTHISNTSRFSLALLVKVSSNVQHGERGSLHMPCLISVASTGPCSGDKFWYGSKFQVKSVPQTLGPAYLIRVDNT